MGERPTSKISLGRMFIPISWNQQRESLAQVYAPFDDQLTSCIKSFAAYGKVMSTTFFPLLQLGHQPLYPNMPQRSQTDVLNASDEIINRSSMS